MQLTTQTLDDLIEETVFKKPYTKIFDLVQLINNGQCNTKVDANYWSSDNELSIVVYPPEWVNNPTVIKHLYVTETAGMMVMLNQIKVIETYLEGVLNESNR